MRRAHQPTTEATRGHLAPVLGPWACAGAAGPLLHVVRSLQGTTRRAAAAPRRTRTTAGREGGPWGLGGLRRVRPRARYPQTVAAWEGPRPVHAVPRASRPRGAASRLPHWRRTRRPRPHPTLKSRFSSSERSEAHFRAFCRSVIPRLAQGESSLLLPGYRTHVFPAHAGMSREAWGIRFPEQGSA